MANILDTIKTNQCSFIYEDQIEKIVEINPFQQVLVRCGNGRFVTPAQNVKHFITCIEKSGIDHIRDLSLLSR